MNKAQLEDPTNRDKELIDDQAIVDYFFPSGLCIVCGSVLACNCADPPSFADNDRMAMRLAGKINQCKDHRFLLRLVFCRQLELYDFELSPHSGFPYVMAACIDGRHAYVIAAAAMHILELRRAEDDSERTETDPSYLGPTPSGLGPA